MSSTLDSEPAKIQLKKSISLISACSMVLGTIIGSGIFITPTSVLASSGSPGVALIVWLTSGLITICGAWCYTELGTMIQNGGGDYAYISTYGSLLSFLYMWMMIFMCFPIYNSVSAITIAKYLVQLFFNDCLAPPFISKLIAALILSLLGFINCLNIKVVAKIQVVFTCAKAAALFIIISAGFWRFIQSSNSTSEILDSWFTMKTSTNLNHFTLAVYSSLFTYSGWNCLNFLTEEMKQPSKDLPRAILISLPLVILIFLTMNIAYFIVLTPQEILFSDTIALSFSEKALYRSFSWLTPFFIAFSAFGSLYSSVLITSRIYYAAARDGNLPDLFATINVNHFTPITSIFLSTLMSILMLLIEDFQILILYGSFSEFLFIGVSVSAILYLRYKNPTATRPIKVFIGFPILFLFVCIVINILTLYQNPYETGIGVLFLLLGIPVYCIAVLWKTKPKGLMNFSSKYKILYFNTNLFKTHLTFKKRIQKKLTL